MSFFLGMLAGLVWGASAALLNGYVSKKCVDKNTSSAMMTASIIRIVVDLFAVGLVLVLKNHLPFSYEGAVIGTVISLSMLTIVISYRIANS